MKNSILATLCLVVLTGFISLKSQAGEDQFICRSTCVLIDSSKATLFSFGSVTGKSEISTDEAFALMAQACKNIATTKGFNGDATALIKGMVQISTDQMSQNAISNEKSRSFKLGVFLNYSRSRSISNSESHTAEDKFSYQINFADDSSCGPNSSNSNGMPKYIGPETPLG